MRNRISALLEPVRGPFTLHQAIAIVFLCTLIGSAAQILMKSGANNLTGGSLLGFVTNLPLMAGYVLYGLSTVLLVLALRDGELSVLYPVIALSYVWVTILSVMFFRESMNFFKYLGIATIVLGVTVLGKGGRR